MSRIVAGRFDETVSADAAVEALRREGFTPQEIESFYVSPPGQHAIDPKGGDAAHSSEGSRKAGAGAVAGALIGAVAGALIGFAAYGQFGIVGVLLAAGLGAYIGSFMGSMSKVRGGRRSNASIEHPVEPLGGRMIAVNVDRSGSEQKAADLLRRHGARDVGRTEGTWRDGSWRDFDPRRPLATV